MLKTLTFAAQVYFCERVTFAAKYAGINYANT